MLIYHLLLFAIVITAILMFIQNRRVMKDIEKINDKNFELVKKVNELTEESNKKDEEKEILVKQISDRYIEENENKNAVSIEGCHDKTEYLSHEEFKIKCEEEIERKKRNRSLIFCVMSVSIDFYNEYQMLYKRIDLEELRREIVYFFKQNLRKIDFIGKGEQNDTIEVLLPMTAAEGAVIVATRLQEKIKDYELKFDNKKLIATLTIVICEAANSTDIFEITGVANRLKEAGSSSGGNTIRVEKI